MISPTARWALLAAALLTACADNAPAPAPQPPLTEVKTTAPATTSPPPVPVAVPQESLAAPPPPDDTESESKAVVDELRETLARGLTGPRNRQRLARVLEAARRDDRPMVRRVLAECAARAAAGAPDAIEWRATMGRLHELADDDAEPAVVEVADRIAAMAAEVQGERASERDAMWQRKAEERARVDAYGGEAFGTAGTRLRFRDQSGGQVTREVHTTADGELALERAP